MQLKWVKPTHGNACIERVLCSKRHQNTNIERDSRSSWFLSDFCCLGTDVLVQCIVPIFKGLGVKMDILIFEDGKDKMSRNVGYITCKVAQQPRKAKVSTNRRRKLEVSYVHSGAENVLNNYRGGIYE